MSVGTAASITAAGDLGGSGLQGKLAEFEQRMRADGHPRRLAGIGDAAVVAEAGMAAYKGDLYVEVTNLRLTESQMIDVMKLALADR